MTEKQGLDIENNKVDTEVYLIFQISGMKNVKYKSWDMQWYNIKQDILKDSSVRLVIGNKRTGDIYFDKQY